MDDYIFIHLESIVNLIYSRGINISDFLAGILHVPTNILLLNTETTDDLLVDNHTLLNEINGSKEIEAYLKQHPDKQNWIDFSPKESLGELTANDIADLLYLGHMKSHLGAPFSYKMQNDFVYLSVGENQVKTYYRRLKNFYLVLNASIVRHAQQTFDKHHFTWFKKIKFESLPKGMLRQLIPILGEGLIFAFDQSFEQNKEVRIPILIASDSNLEPTFRSKDSLYNKAKQVALLKYQVKDKTWEFTITDNQAFDTDALY